MIERIFELGAVVISIIGSIIIIKSNVKKYIILYIASSTAGALLCLLFVAMGFYSFPVKLIPLSPIPMIEMFTTIPFYVLFGVRYSPQKWPWKIPFYWALVHIAMVLEVFVLYHPVKIINYEAKWDAWDSYTWWWIFLLVFEFIGGRIIPAQSRKPISSKSFRYGRWGWIIFHFIVIVTIFLAGYYTGWTAGNR